MEGARSASGFSFPSGAMSRAWSLLPSLGSGRDRSPNSGSERSFTNEAIPENEVLMGSPIPDYLGRDAPIESGLGGEMLKRANAPAHLEKAPFQDKLTFFMLLVLGVPVISCVWMSRHPSVIYWVGYSGFLIPLGTMTWVLLGHDLLTRNLIQRRMAAVIVLVFPITVLLVTGHVHKLTAVKLHSRLLSQDCTNFPGKQRVEQAWQAAKVIFDRCIHLQMNQTGAPLEELQQVTSVTRCLGYEDGTAKWGREWEYLEELELKQRCAGWCTVQAPIWHNMIDYKPHDRCSLVVAEMMGGEVYRLSRQIVFFCCCALFFLAVLFSMIEL